MVQVNPFKAVRPKRDKANLVASRSYESYSPADLGAQLNFNPYSFLQIINPGYKYHQELSGEMRFKLVKNRYGEFKENGIFITDPRPCYYIHKIITREASFCGIIAACSVADYKNGRIKIHEDTLKQRKYLFKNYLKTVGFNAEPVLLMYPDTKAINTLVAEHTEQRAEYEFSTPNHETHYLWVLSDPEIIGIIQNAFKEMEAVYIADGHHRTASSCLLSEELHHKQQSKDAAVDFFMSYLIPESQLRVLEYNRLIKDLNGWSSAEFLVKLDEWFRIENRGQQLYTPSKKHHFSMYLDGSFYSLYLRKNSFPFTDALKALDTQILVDTVLSPILGIKDLRNDDRIAYSTAKKSCIHLKNKVDSGEYAVAFGLYPVSVAQLKQIADSGLKMPPKSTYIEPKLRSGLTIYEF